MTECAIEYRVTVLCTCGKEHSFEDWQTCPLAIDPVPWPPNEMADLLDSLARSADRYESSYSETAHLARYGAATIRQLMKGIPGEKGPTR